MSRSIEVPTAHAIEIAEFLTRPAGKSLLASLYARRPDLRGANFEERSINSGIAEGWEKAVDEISVIALERPESPDLGQSKFMDPSTDNRQVGRASSLI